nr:unnamed protein product [Callosobruchus analis]
MLVTSVIYSRSNVLLLDLVCDIEPQFLQEETNSVRHVLRSRSSRNQSPSLEVSLISQSPLRWAATSNVSRFLFNSTSSLAMTNSMALADPFSRLRNVAMPPFAFDSRLVFLRPPLALPRVAAAPDTAEWWPPPKPAPASTSPPPTVQSIRGSYTNASRRVSSVSRPFRIVLRTFSLASRNIP